MALNHRSFGYIFYSFASFQSYADFRHGYSRFSHRYLMYQNFADDLLGWQVGWFFFSTGWVYYSYCPTVSSTIKQSQWFCQKITTETELSGYLIYWSLRLSCLRRGTTSLNQPLQQLRNHNRVSVKE